jgi:hypothetical protein
VHANIDVGGYAWAKYGYVPTEQSWRNLSSHIHDKIDELAGGGGGEPDSWDMMGEDQRDQVFNAWARETESEFYDSEIESWRDSGGDLAMAKTTLAEMFDPFMSAASSKWNKWAYDYLDNGVVLDKDGKTAHKISELIPVQKLLEYTDVEFRDRRGDGNEDPDITIDDLKTSELTDDQRADIASNLVAAFNKQAESLAPDVDPPQHIHDSIRDSQSDYWSSMRDHDKFKWAVDNDELPQMDTGGGDMGEADAQELRELADDSDPKALWAIADSAHGKDILIDSDWTGVLDLHDSETMARFNAYVNKKPKK